MSLFASAFYHLFIKEKKPDPPVIRKAKQAAGDIIAAAELTNMILPEPKGK